jgi:ABC-type lipoprotein export system ATPase subunit
MKKQEGSTWNKWDLHFHTPASFDYQDKSITNQQLIDELHKNEICAIAITDHHVIDVARVKELQKLGREKGITVFPGIELRSDKGGSDSIHFIGIFSEEWDVELLWSKLKSALTLDPIEIAAQGGDESVYCKFELACELIKNQLNGIVTIHAGKKSNSIENITNALSHKMAAKKDIANAVDIFEVGAIEDIKSYEEIVFPKLGKRKPLIICSDNHHIKKYKLKCNFWVKADLTFNGLEQMINEPDRVYIGETPEINVRKREKSTKYIKSITISKLPNSKLKETWFDGLTIPFNPELVTIIGNKGNGKSALLDIVALLSNIKNQDKYSFLKPSRFKKHDKAHQFEATLEWHSGIGSTDSKNLGDAPEANTVERVKYIPQQFLETLCNDGEEEFLSELKKVIFSHIPKNERLDCEDIDQLLANKTEILQQNITRTKLRLSQLNKEICLLENKQTAAFETALQAALKQKQEELLAHEAIRPAKIDDPSKTVDDASIEISKAVSELTSQLDKLNASIISKQEQKGKNNIIIQNLLKMKQAAKGLHAIYCQHKADFSKLLDGTDLAFEDVVQISTNEILLDETLERCFVNNDEIDTDLSPNNEIGLVFKSLEIEGKRSGLENTLNSSLKQYQKYLTEEDQWLKKSLLIQGKPGEEGSIAHIEATLEYLFSEIQDEIQVKREERIALTYDIYRKKAELIGVYSELYEPVTQFIETYSDILKKYPISLDVSLKERGIRDKFFDYVTHNTRGSFCGTDAGQERLKQLVQKSDFSDFESCQHFLEEVIDSLEYDKREVGTPSREIHSQIRNNRVGEFYDFIFGLDYLVPTYELRLGKKSISELSPGEKGALLLIFYLTLDMDDIPLLIDQPEENLDNQSVYQILVPFIKSAKSKRQIIIVTHNPNIAVVCDAEQVISVTIDKSDTYRVSIISGAIENPDINKRIVEILEGTMPAFSMRSSKYNLNKAFPSSITA